MGNPGSKRTKAGQGGGKMGVIKKGVELREMGMIKGEVASVACTLALPILTNCDHRFPHKFCLFMYKIIK